MIAPTPATETYRPIHIEDHGFGLLTKPSPSQIPFGAALLSENCDYRTRNISNRQGYAYVLENGPGAVKVADFESAEAWSGGAADTTNFVLVEAGADGARGRSLTASAGGGEVAMTLAVGPLSLGTAPLDVFHVWAKAVTMPATITGYTLTLRLQTSGGNHFEVTLAKETDLKNQLEAGLFKYHRFRRQDFAKTGSADWTSISQVRFALTVTTGTGSLTVTVDNLHRTPGLMQELFQFRREGGDFAGARGEYAITNGVLYRNDGKRWVQVFSGFDATEPVYSTTVQDRMILSDGITSPRVLMPDGLTVYRLGIVTPPKQMTAIQLAGGALSDGDYYAQVLFYSSKTGTFSAPDDRVPKTPIVTITGGGGNAGIRFSNIPVSADPQVDFVVIGIRPAASEPELFFRTTDGIFGDVSNGTTTFDFVGSSASVSVLRARSTTAIDPDMDYPSVIEPSTGLPVEAHPKFVVEAGGYVIAIMAEQPTVVRVSRFRAPGSWQLDDEFPVGENDSEPITGIAVTASAVIVMKRDAIYPGRVVGGDDKLAFDPPISDRGATSHKGMVVSGHLLWYRSQDGIYRMPNDMIPRKVTAQQQPTWQGLWDPHGQGFEAAVQIRDADQVLVFGRSLGAVSNDVGWVSHSETVKTDKVSGSRWPEWAATLHRLPADVATEVRMEGISGSGYEAWIGGMGQVWRINFGQEDDGRPIEFTHRTGLIRGPGQAARLWSWIDIEGLVSGTVNLDVRLFVGTARAADSSPLASLKGLSDPLGSFVLGTSRLGAPLYLNERVKIPRVAARYISIELHFRGRARVEIYRLSPWYLNIGVRRVSV